VLRSGSQVLLRDGGGEIKEKPTSFIVTGVLFKVNDTVLAPG
jgi:hypothetical protein